VSHFDELHPGDPAPHVNSLGWRELRPFQEAVFPTSWRRKHLIVLAPTAGGKTEAAFFPIAPGCCPGVAKGSASSYRPSSAAQTIWTFACRGIVRWAGARPSGTRRDHERRRYVLRDPPDCLLTTPDRWS